MGGDSESDSGHFKAAYGLETNEQTRQHYSSWAESYDREVAQENGYVQPARVAEMLMRFRPQPDIRILDAGCGSGLSGVALNASGYFKIDGCDFSPEMLKKSLEKHVYKQLFESNLNIGQPDIADDTYDAVTCVGVFSFGHVFPDACDDLLRILKTGGHLIIALNAPYWDKGDLANKIETLVGRGEVAVLAKEFGDHLPGHNVMGWVIALEKL